jgi:hypothetical protein
MITPLVPNVGPGDWNLIASFPQKTSRTSLRPIVAVAKIPTVVTESDTGS